MALQLLWVLLLALVMLALALGPVLRDRHPYVWWCLLGYPATVVRARLSWRRLTTMLGLAVPRRPANALLGDLVVRGDPLKPVPPQLGMPKLLRGGLSIRVRLHPGQVPEQLALAADAITHAWRVYGVRVTSGARGFATVTAMAWDPLAASSVPYLLRQEMLRAVVGMREDGEQWVINFRRVPHWLIVGATRSGKSTLIAALVSQLARQRVALFGIDLKGGMELSLFEPRLSALASDRSQAAQLIGELVREAEARMKLCRTAGARSIWDLPGRHRLMPIVVIVDEVAELYLTATRDDKAEVGEISTNLLRLAQLGAALGIHLVIAGQRVGSDLGPGVTALRAQLGGRVCHRVSDPGTAEMALGDLDKDALTAAQQITPAEQGIAITTGDDGRWLRARSIHTTPGQARRTARKHAHLAPTWPGLTETTEPAQSDDTEPDDTEGVYL
ncbi:FtsK/SpoIIIE domain-containing protein [Saccharothrix sp. ST-888]|uniref:FtsK/SpoIIIE domain-containing protein n=1 Tax=Saccharothrix sp. ST-888 TaxID=1427391 RepID=UPI0005ED08D4|nr:FtsK/SpoIIIE domain-containing protein [Saccharothrix sp. ST-888]KJK57708.1 cell division protein FtsK [Saccharothrix sp. ST-888]